MPVARRMPRPTAAMQTPAPAIRETLRGFYKVNQAITYDAQEAKHAQSNRRIKRHELSEVRDTLTSRTRSKILNKSRPR